MKNRCFLCRILTFLLLQSVLSCNTTSNEKDLSTILLALGVYTHQSGSPILNPLITRTSYVNVDGQNKQNIYVDFSFRNVPAAPITIRAYLGRPALMVLDSDGETVRNYLQEMSPDSFTANRFYHYSRELTQSYKIIVVAKNFFGKSSREITSTPSTPLANFCDSTVPSPVTVGNCADHCIQIATNATNLEFVASSTNTSVQDYLYLDFITFTPNGEIDSTPFAFIELGLEEPSVPVAVGTRTTTLRTLNIQTYEHACIEVSSYRVWDGAGGFSDSYVSGKIQVP
ncbi:putative lipoprotein [Leptospira santarosai str. CBC379]|uniref:Lipoprotein n=1 Tax=Leptospira santarosai str. MOR084 TaxID=1049984 RepID=A0A0E2BKN7_9LEPT|nr:hypothetical protein [Leptospira santarosai]EKO35834.1 putative lipoprotein [Leptospira santarosai str. MOR084]EKR93054.1 putative lipoprotein [Leptospira santarosai str. CBC379]